MSDIKNTFDNTKDKVMKNLKNTGEMQAMKKQISVNEREIAGLYIELGRRYYENMAENPDSECGVFIEQIKENIEKQEELKSRKELLKNQKMCPVCGGANYSTAQFCFSCGKAFADNEENDPKKDLENYE